MTLVRTLLDRIADAESDVQKLLTEFPNDPSAYEAGILIANKKGDDALAAEYQGKLNAIVNTEAEP